MRRLVALASLVIPASAVATEAEIELSAEAKFYAVTGNLGHKLDDDEDSSDGFRQKTEIEVAARYLDPARGRRWGAIFQFEGELDGTSRTQKSYAFIQGPPGELRAGLDDAPAVAMQIGAGTIAVASGGIDGELVASDDLVIPRIVDTDGPRLIAYTPTVAGWRLGTSFTTATDELDDVFDMTLLWLAGDEDGGAAVSLSGAVEQDGGRALQLGGLLSHDDLAIAGSVALDRVAEDGGDWRRFANLGVAGAVEEVDLSLTAGWCFACDDRGNWNVVLGLEREWLPGVSLGLELSRFDEADGSHDSGSILLFSLDAAF